MGCHRYGQPCAAVHLRTCGSPNRLPSKSPVRRLLSVKSVQSLDFCYSFRTRWAKINCSQVRAVPRTCPMYQPFTACTSILTRVHPKFLRNCFRRDSAHATLKQWRLFGTHLTNSYAPPTILWWRKATRSLIAQKIAKVETKQKKYSRSSNLLFKRGLQRSFNSIFPLFLIICLLSHTEIAFE